MNRQIRRAEEKKERKAEREKAKAKAERQARRRERRQARVARAEARAKGGSADAKEVAKKASPQASGPRKTNPGRFSGVLMAATIFFIALQTVAPTDGTVASQAVAASFYLLFGYFAVLWMNRREAARPLLVAIAAGVMMTIATAASQIFQPSLEVAPIMLALAVPAVVAGAFLGRLVWNRAP